MNGITQWEVKEIIREKNARIAKLEQFLQEAVIHAADWARKAGEAQGKLELSETAGVLDGWKRENQELRSKIARMEQEQ